MKVVNNCIVKPNAISIEFTALLTGMSRMVEYAFPTKLTPFCFPSYHQAAKEFSNPRLKMHVLTVLKSMPSMRKKHITSLSASLGSNHMVIATDSDSMVPVELFGLLAMCERQKNPGEALLVKAKELRWSLLAMTASCFPDVSPLSCLTIWLEITAARLEMLFRA